MTQRILNNWCYILCWLSATLKKSITKLSYIKTELWFLLVEVQAILIPNTESTSSVTVDKGLCIHIAELNRSLHQKGQAFITNLILNAIWAFLKYHKPFSMQENHLPSGVCVDWSLRRMVGCNELHLKCPCCYSPNYLIYNGTFPTDIVLKCGSRILMDFWDNFKRL